MTNLLDPGFYVPWHQALGQADTLRHLRDQPEGRSETPHSTL
ncbi:MAG TPA: hypothetical protein VEF71_19300 [Streptosporangiaceae bacterium]|nr:hypothetical protein [Streptosporangiaceae bacterium]